MTTPQPPNFFAIFLIWKYGFLWFLNMVLSFVLPPIGLAIALPLYLSKRKAGVVPRGQWLAESVISSIMITFYVVLIIVNFVPK